MKKSILTLAFLVFCGVACAQINIQRNEFGSGTPGRSGFENAQPWIEGSGIYSTPQYMPGYPTSAAIWPRIVEVECEQVALTQINCKGFNWSPELGRAEYLMIRPKLAKKLN